jgi:hypothetical protein
MKIRFNLQRWWTVKFIIIIIILINQVFLEGTPDSVGQQCDEDRRQRESQLNEVNEQQSQSENGKYYSIDKNYSINIWFLKIAENNTTPLTHHERFGSIGELNNRTTTIGEQPEQPILNNRSISITTNASQKN